MAFLEIFLCGDGHNRLPDVDPGTNTPPPTFEIK
jgi:hypothetical protein